VGAIGEFVLRMPQNVVFGSGVRLKLGAHARSRGQRPLVIVGGTSLQESGELDRILGLLRSAGLEAQTFTGVEAEPSLETVERGRQALKEHKGDLVIAIGGGSVLDVGKAVGALGRTQEPVETFFAGQALETPGYPVIALPTTSGTGAEVTPNSVLTDHRQPKKASIRGEPLIPALALVDPELTLSLPREQTAYSGLDALTQALEAYVSRGANPASDALALTAIEHCGCWLEATCAQGPDLEAREHMSLGSLLAGIALASARLGLVHGMAHPLGALYGVPHGLVCGTVLPFVLKFNLQIAGEKYARAARAIGITDDPRDTKAAEALLEWTDELCQELGVGKPFKEYGGKAEDASAIVEATMSSGSTKHNPREVTKADAFKLWQDVLEGRL